MPERGDELRAAQQRAVQLLQLLPQLAFQHFGVVQVGCGHEDAAVGRIEFSSRSVAACHALGHSDQEFGISVL